MCMFMDKDTASFKTKALHGYKVIQDNQSILQPHKWVIGENISSRTITSLYKYEHTYADKGFHVFIYLKDAKIYADETKDTIIKVYYKRENIVAYGKTTYRNQIGKVTNTVLLTKCAVKSLEDVRKDK